jgi:hypothetical protein
MYVIKTITRPDGSTYESAFWHTSPENRIPLTEQQDQMQRAIDQFGTSS